MRLLIASSLQSSSCVSPQQRHRLVLRCFGNDADCGSGGGPRAQRHLAHGDNDRQKLLFPNLIMSIELLALALGC